MGNKILEITTSCDRDTRWGKNVNLPMHNNTNMLILDEVKLIII